MEKKPAQMTLEDESPLTADAETVRVDKMGLMQLRGYLRELDQWVERLLGAVSGTPPPQPDAEPPKQGKTHGRRPLEVREPWRLIEGETPPRSDACTQFLLGAEIMRGHGLSIAQITRVISERWPENGPGNAPGKYTIGDVIRKGHNFEWMRRSRSKGSTFPEGQMFWGGMLGEKKPRAAASIICNLSLSDMAAAKEY